MNSPLSRSRLAAKRDRRRKVLQVKLRSSMKLKRFVHSKWAEPRARLTILLAVAVLFACGALLWQSFSTTASAQEPEAVLVRGDGYQVLEGLDLVSISTGEDITRKGTAVCARRVRCRRVWAAGRRDNVD